MTATACASRGPPAVGALDPSLTTPSVLRRAPTQNQTNTGPIVLSQPRTTPHGNTSSNKPFRKPAAASSKSRAAAGRLRRPTRMIFRRHRCKDLSGGTMCLSSRLLDWILLASPWPAPKPALRKHHLLPKCGDFGTLGIGPCVYLAHRTLLQILKIPTLNQLRRSRNACSMCGTTSDSRNSRILTNL